MSVVELAVIDAIVTGKRNRIPEEFVQIHLPYICKKLGVSTQEEMARFAIDHELPSDEILAKKSKPNKKGKP